MKMLQRHISTLLVLLSMALAACTSNEKKLGENLDNSNWQEPPVIAELEAELEKTDSMSIALPIARKLESELIRLTADLKNDTNAAKYLYKAARLNEAYFGDYAEAFAHYNSIAEEFPNTRFGAVAMFKRGLIMETYFEKSDKAIYYLDEYLRKNPGHKLNDMAKQMITTSGIDPKELYNRIMQKNVDSTDINTK